MIFTTMPRPRLVVLFLLALIFLLWFIMAQEGRAWAEIPTLVGLCMGMGCPFEDSYGECCKPPGATCPAEADSEDEAQDCYPDPMDEADRKIMEEK